MRGIPADTAGLESIPLKLIIVAVVATMSVVPAAQALTGLENRDFGRRAEVQLDLIVTTAQVLTVQGPGNVRTISLDFSGEGSLQFERLCIGDPLGGPNSSSAKLVLNNGAVLTRVAQDPPCTFCSSSMACFVSSLDRIELRMAAVLDNRTTLVIVEAV